MITEKLSLILGGLLSITTAVLNNFLYVLNLEMFLKHTYIYIYIYDVFKTLIYIYNLIVIFSRVIKNIIK
jgi:hypothetical protein